MEVYYWILNNFGKEYADRFYDNAKKYCIEITDDIIKSATEFRAKNKSKNLSYVDCIGYMIARSLNIKFLTGDMQFKNMENVEFVK